MQDFKYLSTQPISHSALYLMDIIDADIWLSVPIFFPHMDLWLAQDLQVLVAQDVQV